MAKKSRKARRHETQSQGDIGQQTAAQMINQRISELEEENGAKFQRRIKDSHIAKMALPNGLRPAMISPRQAVAGMIYKDAADMTELSGEVTWARILVDYGSRRGDINPAKLDAVAKVKQIEAVIPRDVRQLCRRVCLDEESISKIARGDSRRIGKFKGQLGRGLDAVAREFKIWA